jgi:P pilus assembly chaperone PapD
VKKVISAIFLLVFLFAASTAFARIGVGVGTGKIVVNEDLKPGIIYNLPPLTVVNTGDEPSEYEVDISYHQDQKELQPAKNWFIFSPAKFQLNPGEAKVVDIKTNLPINAEPGEYFAYLEGHPLKKAQNGTTSVGVAAAAKLYFTVVPASPLQAIYYKIVSFWNVYAPWTHYGAIAAGVISVILIMKRYLNIQVNVKKGGHKAEKKDE